MIIVKYNQKDIKVCRDCLEEHLDIIAMNDTGDYEFVENEYLFPYIKDLEEY